MLDAHPSFQHMSCQIVKDNNCNWWKIKKPQSLALAEVLNASSITDCMETHSKQLAEDKQPNSSIPPIPTSTSPISPQPCSSGFDCQNCMKYAQILTNSLQDLLYVHHWQYTMVTSYKAQWNSSMCQASMFNLLLEAAVIKDVASPVKDDSPCSQSLSSSSLKWTWDER